MYVVMHIPQPLKISNELAKKYQWKAYTSWITLRSGGKEQTNLSTKNLNAMLYKDLIKIQEISI